MSNIFGKKDVDYFEMFEKAISVSYQAALRLQTAFADGTINLDELKLVKEAEHEGDKIVHESMKIIDVAFITPIDRTDIVEILNGIEGITDSIEAVANHIYMMHIVRSNDYLGKFVQLVVVSCQRLHDLMSALKMFKKNRKDLNAYIIEINRLEEEGDRTYSESMRNLFDFETNPITIIKNKEIYQLLENALDCCEDVADIVEKMLTAKT